MNKTEAVKICEKELKKVEISTVRAERRPGVTTEELIALERKRSFWLYIMARLAEEAQE